MGLIRGTLRLLGAILKTLAALAIIGVAGYFILTRVFGARIERDGSGMMPIVSFTAAPEQHIAALELDRAAQAPVTPPEAPPAPAPVSEPAPEPEPEPKQAEAAPQPVPVSAPAAPWPDFRGPNRDGVIQGVAIRTGWPLEELWRTKVGGGYASMVSAEGKVFTIEQRRDQEVVAAYDLATGREVWTHAWAADFQESMGGPGPRATPTYAAGRLYALGALGDLRAIQASNGELVWKSNILADAGASNLTWGMSGAPLVVDGRVIVTPGGGGGKSVAAYDSAGGKILWQSLDADAGYASPHLMTLAGKRQALVFMGHSLVSIDPADGRPLWSQDWHTSYGINSAQPIQVSGDQIWFSSGYGHGSALTQVRASGNGYTAERLWETNTMKNKFNSSVEHQGYVYGLDEGIMACIDLKTGERVWKGGRYGFGQLLLADGHLIVLTERGDLVLVKATPESHQEVASFPVLQGKTWNVPAYADGKLLVRNQTEMAAYQLAQ